MTGDQLTQQIMAQSKDIAALRERVKSAHKRIDENDRITTGIHKLASNVEALALQVKLLTERMDSSINRMEKSIKSQDERIGAIEKEPATKWKELVRQMIALAVAALAGSMLASFIA